ncbi:MAG: Zn-ribbon domain-containing OB-fold protein [Candidatus Undinarchaeales archaeon]
MSVARFWREQPQRYNLWGTKCRDCGKIHFPPREICPECQSTKLDKEQLGKNGKIVTYTVIRVAPEGFEKEVPYIIAIIEMKGGSRLTAQVVDADPEDIEIGKKVEAVFRRISEDGSSGAIYYGYKFKLKE